jgi:hypothetical protein
VASEGRPRLITRGAETCAFQPPSTSEVELGLSALWRAIPSDAVFPLDAKEPQPKLGSFARPQLET